MAVSRYYQQGATTGLLGFFNNDKRLALLDHVLPNINALSTDLQRPLEILDIGAGTGLHAAYLAKGGHHVTAVDPSESMLAEGKKNYPELNINFVVDSLPALTTIANKKFDVVYSIAAWQYLQPEDRQAAMKRVIELLNPGGLFAIIWPVPMSRNYQYPLSSEDINETITVINKQLPHNMQIHLTVSAPILDPDKRKGFIETSKDVYFHTIQGQLPMPELRNELRKTAGK